MCRTPSSLSASTMALITAASAGVVPPSPPERTPRRFDGDPRARLARDPGRAAISIKLNGHS